MPSIMKLEEIAEKERCAGHRQKFLTLQKEIEVKKQEEVLAKHKAYLEQVKKEFKIGSYIPELQGTVKEIKDGCGTQRGWIEVYLSGREKALSPSDIHKKIAETKALKESNERFNKIKLSDSKKAIRIGENYPETLDDLVRVMCLDLPDSETIFDWNLDSFSETYSYALKQAKEEGYTDEESEEKAQEAEAEARDEDFDKYQESIIRTLNYLLNLHGLRLEEKKGYYYISLAVKSWHEVADKVASTISGYGTFEYESGKQLKEIGPYKSYCEAVCKHIHWLKYYPEVYGNTNYRRVYER